MVKAQFDVRKDLIYHPFFDGEQRGSHIKMDMVVTMPLGNVIIAYKSIKTAIDNGGYTVPGLRRYRA